MTIGEITQLLAARAEEKLGKERASELQPEIEVMVTDLLKLSAATATMAGTDDEP